MSTVASQLSAPPPASPRDPSPLGPSRDSAGFDEVFAEFSGSAERPAGSVISNHRADGKPDAENEETGAVTGVALASTSEPLTNSAADADAADGRNDHSRRLIEARPVTNTTSVESAAFDTSSGATSAVTSDSIVAGPATATVNRGVTGAAANTTGTPLAISQAGPGATDGSPQQGDLNSPTLFGSPSAATRPFTPSANSVATPVALPAAENSAVEPTQVAEESTDRNTTASVIPRSTIQPRSSSESTPVANASVHALPLRTGAGKQLNVGVEAVGDPRNGTETLLLNSGVSVSGSAPQSAANPTAASWNPPPTFTSQVASAVLGSAWIAEDAESGLHRLIVDLDPPELGSLRIAVQRTDDGLVLKIDAADQVTLEMLSTRSGEIEQVLRDRNVNVHSFEVDLLTGDSDLGAGRQYGQTGNGDRHLPNPGGGFPNDRRRMPPEVSVPNDISAGYPRSGWRSVNFRA